MRAGVAVLVLAGILTACGEGEPTSATTSALPPHLYEDLVPLLQPLVDPLGYRVSRASLIDPVNYQNVPDGTHLAVYLEPLDVMTPNDYAAATVTTAAAFIPAVFDRWPGLASFDVCQEIYGWEGSTSPSHTLVNVTREAAAPFDWSSMDLATLIDAAGTGFTVWAHTEVRHSETWTEADAG